MDLYEHFENLYSVGEVIYETDVIVEGLTCRAESP